MFAKFTTKIFRFEKCNFRESALFYCAPLHQQFSPQLMGNPTMTQSIDKVIDFYSLNLTLKLKAESKLILQLVFSLYQYPASNKSLHAEQFRSARVCNSYRLSVLNYNTKPINLLPTCHSPTKFSAITKHASHSKPTITQHSSSGGYPLMVVVQLDEDLTLQSTRFISVVSYTIG